MHFFQHQSFSPILSAACIPVTAPTSDLALSFHSILFAPVRFDLRHLYKMSYAEVAAKGPKQSPEEVSGSFCVSKE